MGREWGNYDMKEIRGVKVESPSGWDDLIDRTDAAIAELDPDYKVLQIKEKFGGLRYYMMGSKSADRETMVKIGKIIDDAEAESFTICESCGTKNSDSTPVTTEGTWLRTLCGPCRKRQQKARDKLWKEIG